MIIKKKFFMFNSYSKIICLFDKKNNKRIDYVKIKKMFSALIEFGCAASEGAGCFRKDELF